MRFFILGLWMRFYIHCVALWGHVECGMQRNVALNVLQQCDSKYLLIEILSKPFIKNVKCDRIPRPRLEIKCNK